MRRAPSTPSSSPSRRWVTGTTSGGERFVAFARCVRMDRIAVHSTVSSALDLIPSRSACHSMEKTAHKGPFFLRELLNIQQVGCPGRCVHSSAVTHADRSLQAWWIGSYLARSGSRLRCRLHSRCTVCASLALTWRACCAQTPRATKDQFLRYIFHELRVPLNTVCARGRARPAGRRWYRSALTGTRACTGQHGGGGAGTAGACQRVASGEQRADSRGVLAGTHARSRARAHDT